MQEVFSHFHLFLNSQTAISHVLFLWNAFVLPVAAMFTLPKLGLGADGVWLAVPAAEMLSLCLSIFLLRRHRKRFGY